MDGGASYNPRTVEEVFRDFTGRRAALIKALTTGYFNPTTSFFLFLFNNNNNNNPELIFFFFFFWIKSKLTFFFLGVCVCVSPDVEEFYQQCDPGNVSFRKNY